MLARNHYDQEYVDVCRARMHQQVSAYRAVANAGRKQPDASAESLNSAIDAFLTDLERKFVAT